MLPYGMSTNLHMTRSNSDLSHISQHFLLKSALEAKLPP